MYVYLCIYQVKSVEIRLVFSTLVTHYLITPILSDKFYIILYSLIVLLFNDIKSSYGLRIFSSAFSGSLCVCPSLFHYTHKGFYYNNMYELFYPYVFLLIKKKYCLSICKKNMVYFHLYSF